MCGSSEILRVSACAAANCPMPNPVLDLSKAPAASSGPGTPRHGTVVTPGDWHLSLFDIHFPVAMLAARLVHSEAKCG